jgi:hypothetical protein
MLKKEIFLGQILIISYMCNKDLKLIIRIIKLSYKKYFACQIQEFLEMKCKYITILNN